MSSVTTPVPLDTDYLRATVEGALRGTAPVRDRNHPSRCPLSAERLVALLTPGRALPPASVPPGCVDGCYPLLLDVLQRLDWGRPRASVGSPFAWARKVAQSIAVDAVRAENARFGGPAKPERRDGVLGRIRSALPPGLHDALFTEMLRAACARAPIPDGGWPYERWSSLPGAPGASRDELRAAVSLVLDTAARIAGTRWVDENLWAGFRARAVHFAPVVEDDRGAASAADPDTDSTEVEAAELLRREFFEQLRSSDPVTALRAAATCVSPSASADVSALDDATVAAVAEQYILEHAVTLALSDRPLDALPHLPAPARQGVERQLRGLGLLSARPSAA